jgi:hypothetical protein
MKNLLLVLPAIALVFTMTVVGCDDSSTDTSQTVRVNAYSDTHFFLPQY